MTTKANDGKDFDHQTHKAGNTTVATPHEVSVSGERVCDAADDTTAESEHTSGDVADDDGLGTAEDDDFEAYTTRYEKNSIGSYVLSAFNNFQVLACSKDRFTGALTGYKDIDELVGGFCPGELVVIASQAADGKTSLALNIASRAAQLGSHVAYFSLETDAEQLVSRLLGAEARIAQRKIRTGSMTAQDWQRLVGVADTLSRLPVWIDSTPRADISCIYRKACEQMHDTGDATGLIVVDCIQLIEPSLLDANRQEETAEIVRQLKILARELEVAVIAVSQLNRTNGPYGKPRRPVLSDLRDSGAIEQMADIVMLVDRSMSIEEAELDNRPPLGVADVIIAKNNRGETGCAHLAFQGEYMRFDSLLYSEERVDD